MELSLEGANFIIGFEGYKSKPYLDSRGVPTIGCGSTYYIDGSRVEMGDSEITLDTAKELLQHHIDTQVIAYIEDIQPLNNLAQNKIDAILSIAYNIGVTAFKDSSLLKAIQQNADDTTIIQKFRMWNKSGGKALDGLIKRREAEATLYTQGTY